MAKKTLEPAPPVEEEALDPSAAAEADDERLASVLETYDLLDNHLLSMVVALVLRGGDVDDLKRARWFLSREIRRRGE